MSFEGSIDTVALPDLLSLLATTRKTGQLRISGDHLHGELWLDDGDLIGSEVGLARTPLDAVFQLLRVPAGVFSFHTNVAIPPPVDAVPLLGLLEVALARLEEWRAIELVVPSLASVIRLAAELPRSEATIGADQWRLIGAIGNASSVFQILDRLDLGVFDGCQAIKELVEVGVIRVDEPVGQMAPPVDRVIELTGPAQRVDAVAVHRPIVDPQQAPPTDVDPPIEGPRDVVIAAAVPAMTADPVPAPQTESDLAPAGDAPEVFDAGPASGEELEVGLAPAEAEVQLSSDEPAIEVSGSPQLEAEAEAGGIEAGRERDEPLSRGALLKLLSSVGS